MCHPSKCKHLCGCLWKPVTISCRKHLLTLTLGVIYMLSTKLICFLKDSIWNILQGGKSEKRSGATVKKKQIKRWCLSLRLSTSVNTELGFYKQATPVICQWCQFELWHWHSDHKSVRIMCQAALLLCGTHTHLPFSETKRLEKGWTWNCSGCGFC